VRIGWLDNSLTSAVRSANCCADSTFRAKKIAARTPRATSALVSDGMLFPSNPTPTMRAANRSISAMQSVSYPLLHDALNTHHLFFFA
jgi:hypothetical protein